jgi:hypothetical protein
MMGASNCDHRWLRATSRKSFAARVPLNGLKKILRILLSSGLRFNLGQRQARLHLTDKESCLLRIPEPRLPISRHQKASGQLQSLS